MAKNILLDEEDFKKLTKGEVIEKDGIKNSYSRYWIYNND